MRSGKGETSNSSKKGSGPNITNSTEIQQMNKVSNGLPALTQRKRRVQLPAPSLRRPQGQLRAAWWQLGKQGAKQRSSWIEAWVLAVGVREPSQ